MVSAALTHYPKHMKCKDTQEKQKMFMSLKTEFMTGVDGVFDPGANTVGLTKEGAGRTD